MLEGVVGSLIVKILAVVTGFAGVAGGLAAAGALPGLGSDSPEVDA